MNKRKIYIYLVIYQYQKDGANFLGEIFVGIKNKIKKVEHFNELKRKLIEYFDTNLVVITNYIYIGRERSSNYQPEGKVQLKEFSV